MIKRIAAENRLRVALDECGDPIISGKRGHLYVDDGELCAMWADARPMNATRLAELGGRLWQGDISPNSRGSRVQDAWVRGINPAKVKLAIRMVGAKAKRVMSPAQTEVLEKARLASPLFQSRPVRNDILLP